MTDKEIRKWYLRNKGREESDLSEDVVYIPRLISIPKLIEDYKNGR